MRKGVKKMEAWTTTINAYTEKKEKYDKYVDDLYNFNNYQIYKYSIQPTFIEIALPIINSRFKHKINEIKKTENKKGGSKTRKRFISSKIHKSKSLKKWTKKNIQIKMKKMKQKNK